MSDIYDKALKALRTLAAVAAPGATRQAAEHGIAALEECKARIAALEARVSELDANESELCAAQERVAMMIPVGECVGPIEEDIEWHLKRLRARIATLEAAVDAVKNLINESRGVAGLHLNDGIAEWDELMESAWLEPLSAALAGKGD